MPSYATISDMLVAFDESELVQLTDDEGSGAINTVRLTKALEKADNIIDGFVGAYYRRLDSLAPVPPLLTDIACVIARHKSYRSQTPTEQVKADYDDAMRQLDKIAKGVIKLDQGEEVLAPRDGQILIDSSDRRFTRDSLGGY